MIKHDLEALHDSKNCTFAASTSRIWLNGTPAFAINHRQVGDVVLWPILQTHLLLRYRYGTILLRINCIGRSRTNAKLALSITACTR